MAPRAVGKRARAETDRITAAEVGISLRRSFQRRWGDQRTTSAPGFDASCAQLPRDLAIMRTTGKVKPSVCASTARVAAALACPEPPLAEPAPCSLRQVGGTKRVLVRYRTTITAQDRLAAMA